MVNIPPEGEAWTLSPPGPQPNFLADPSVLVWQFTIKVISDVQH